MTLSTQLNTCAPVGGFNFGGGNTAENSSGPFGTEFGNPGARFAQWDNSSDPFGRVESTPMCFARNGDTAATPTRSRVAPSRSPFESQRSTQPAFAFGSNASESGQRMRLFGQTTQPCSQSLFGSGQRSSVFGNSANAISESGRSEPAMNNGGFSCGSTSTSSTTCPSFGFGRPKLVVHGGGFSFGSTSTPTNITSTAMNADFSRVNVSFGECNTHNSFGQTKNVFRGTNFGASGSGFDSNFSTESRSTPFSSSGQTTELHFGETSTRFDLGIADVKPSNGNPFAMAATNPFAKSAATNVAANSFATKGSTPNPFALKVARGTTCSTANPLVTTKTSDWTHNAITSNLFGPSSTTNPFDFSGSDHNLCTNARSTELHCNWSGFKFGSVMSSDKAFGPTLKDSGNTTTSLWAFKQQSASVTQSQPASFTGFDWKASEKRQDLAQPSTMSSLTSDTPTINPLCTTIAPGVMVPVTASTSTAPLVSIASENSLPRSGSCDDDGLLELKVKTAVANPPSRKVLDVRSPHKQKTMPPRQISARFAARLGLARQPLHQVLPMRSAKSRFPGRRPTVAHSKTPQADPFCFSSAFSRLAISKRARVKPSVDDQQKHERFK